MKFLKEAKTNILITDYLQYALIAVTGCSRQEDNELKSNRH